MGGQGLLGGLSQYSSNDYMRQMMMEEEMRRYTQRAGQSLEYAKSKVGDNPVLLLLGPSA